MRYSFGCLVASILFFCCGESNQRVKELESSYNKTGCIKEIQSYEYEGEFYESEAWLIKLEGISPGELVALWLCYESGDSFFMCEEPFIISYSEESNTTVISCETEYGIRNDSHYNTQEEHSRIRDKARYVLFWKSI